MTRKKPNVLIIWGVDIGWFNISAYNHGIMGYKTPNIDRVAREGVLFTDWYGQQSCTTGRTAFITGQSPLRTGLTRIPLPSGPRGLQPETPTIAQLLKAQGYSCGQFGTSHLGDREQFLPTMHGFDEFFGISYPLHAENEPESETFTPTNSRFRNAGSHVVRSWANPDGTQKIEYSDPLSKTRRETLDDKITAAAIGFIDRQSRADKPFFCWWNSTRMQGWKHLKKESRGKTGLGPYADSVVEHDGHVGQLLGSIEELGIVDNTIVMYSTDTGADELKWPDGGTTPFRGERHTNWDGGWRVPTAIRWPGIIKPGTVSNEIFSHYDVLPTLMAAAGEPNIVEKCKRGYRVGDKTYKVHLDGFNLMPHLTGKVKNPRPGFLYWSDAGDLVAVRYDNWKVHFAVQHFEGVEAWKVPLERLSCPMLVNLRADPFENAEVAADLSYRKWRVDRIFALAPASALVDEYVKTLSDFPPRQIPELWSLRAVMENLRRQRKLLEYESVPA
jgi:arylsulfatase